MKYEANSRAELMRVAKLLCDLDVRWKTKFTDLLIYDIGTKDADNA